MSRGPGIMQREIIRRASARRSPFTVREMASKLYAELDDTKLGAVRRALRGLVTMGYLKQEADRYSRTARPQPTRPEWITPLDIVRIEFAEADKMLEPDPETGRVNHYLGAAGWKRGYCLSTPTRDALAIFAPPVAAHFNQVLDCPLELTRLWHSEDCPWPLSQFLARALRWIKREAPLLDPQGRVPDCIFSYADPAAINPVTGRAHVGGIYTASNFAFVGTSHRTGHWLDEAGDRVSLPMCYRLFKTKSAGKIAALRPGWRFVAGERKNLFVFPMRLKLPAVLALIGGDGKRYQPGALPGGGHYSPQWQVKIKADLGDLW
jgi:hypothetical protein